MTNKIYEILEFYKSFILTLLAPLNSHFFQTLAPFKPKPKHLYLYFPNDLEKSLNHYIIKGQSKMVYTHPKARSFH